MGSFVLFMFMNLVNIMILSVFLAMVIYFGLRYEGFIIKDRLDFDFILFR